MQGKIVYLDVACAQLEPGRRVRPAVAAAHGSTVRQRRPDGAAKPPHERVQHQLLAPRPRDGPRRGHRRHGSVLYGHGPVRRHDVPFPIELRVGLEEAQQHTERVAERQPHRPVAVRRLQSVGGVTYAKAGRGGEG